MANGYVGSNGGPYAAGKIYCGFCGEYRRYGIGIVTSESGKLVCIECGLQARPRGRRWLKTHPNEPIRY